VGEFVSIHAWAGLVRWESILNCCPTNKKTGGRGWMVGTPSFVLPRRDCPRGSPGPFMPNRSQASEWSVGGEEDAGRIHHARRPNERGLRNTSSERYFNGTKKAQNELGAFGISRPEAGCLPRKFLPRTRH